MPESNMQTLLIVFVALTGFALLVQAAILFALLCYVRKIIRTADEFTQIASKTLVKITPVIESTRNWLARVEPKIESTVDNMKSISVEMCRQSADISACSSEIVDRLRHHAARLDAMLTDAVNSVAHANAVVRNVVGAPARQLNTVKSVVRAVVDSLRGAQSARPRTRSNRDSDMFV